MKGKQVIISRAKGGKVKSYTADDPNVEKEAEKEKKGGAVKKKDGGKVERAAGGKVRLDRAVRKDGGRVGSNKSPLSSAANIGSRPGGGEK